MDNHYTHLELYYHRLIVIGENWQKCHFRLIGGAQQMSRLVVCFPV